MWLKCEIAVVMNSHFLALNEHCAIRDILCWGNSLSLVALMAFLRLACSFRVWASFFSAYTEIWHRIFRIKTLFFSSAKTRCVCWASCYVSRGGLKSCMRFCFHLLIHVVGEKYNIILSFFSSSQILHHSLFLSWSKKKWLKWIFMMAF